jgi:hypothetical protein
MNTKPNNPSAFPLAMPDQYHPEGAPLQQGFIDSGMTLRDYFAAKAINKALCMSNDYYDVTDKDGGFYPCAAQIAYKLADAMLSEREKGGK